MRRVSKSKQAEHDRFYKEVKPAWLKENPTCQFKNSHGFTCGSNWNVTIHHKMRRGKFLNDRRYFITLCGWHHSFVETHKKEARELGLILYK